MARKKSTQQSEEAEVIDDENRPNYANQDDDYDGDEGEEELLDEQGGQQNDDYGGVFSGMTEAERREVRKEQRALQKKLVDGDGIEVEDARGENNKIFKRVKFTREAVLDGDNLNLIATKASHKMDRLIQVRLSFWESG